MIIEFCQATVMDQSDTGDGVSWTGTRDLVLLCPGSVLKLPKSVPTASDRVMARGGSVFI